MRALLRWTLLPALLAGWLAATSAPAALLVAPVVDRADVFSDAAIQKAEKLIREIHTDFKEDLLIETCAAIPADRLEAFDKAKDNKADYARFFQEWARSRAKELEVKGVYLLIFVPKDPKLSGRVQDEVGAATRKKAFNDANIKGLTDIFLKKFGEAVKATDEAEKKKLHDEALIEGVQYVGRSMKMNLGGK